MTLPPLGAPPVRAESPTAAAKPAGQPAATVRANPRIEQVELVLEPAAGAIGATEALLLRRTVAALLESLGEVLQVPVSRTIGHAEPPKGPAFAAALVHPWLRGPALVAVDMPLARALVDTVELMSAGLAGAGPVTEAELGLLDYLTLRVLDAGVRKAGPAGGEDAWQLRRLLLDETCDGHAAAAWLGRHPLLRATAVPVAVGGRPGTMSLFMPPLQQEGVPLADLLAEGRAASSLNKEVGVRVLLPPVEMSTEAAARMQPGDVVVPGWGDLDAALADGRLLSETGWVLCDAAVTSHSPTLVRVRLGDWSPAVWTDPAEERARRGEAGRVHWHPLVGGRMLRRDQLVRMRGGDELEMTLEASPVALVGRGRERWGGEWVRLDGEVGIRLTERVAREGGDGEVRVAPEPKVAGGVGLMDEAGDSGAPLTGDDSVLG